MQEPGQRNGSSNHAWNLVHELARRVQSSNHAWDSVHELAKRNLSSDRAWDLVQELADRDDQSSNEGSKRSEETSNGQSSSNGGSSRRNGLWIRPPDSINIWVMNEWKKEQPSSRWYCMKKHDPLSALMQKYCYDYKLNRADMRFLFEDNVIFETQTPNDLNMKTGVIIRALKCEAYEDDKSATKSNGGSQNSQRNNDPANSDCFITGVTHKNDPVAFIDLCDD